mmetsp:Transcript_3139/g.5514  ORF Transcript_3139/g.5514 Transcript_3139/m.5514 type:complete len:240 (+) Transcript_3139:446-1165(+)
MRWTWARCSHPAAITPAATARRCSSRQRTLRCRRDRQPRRSGGSVGALQRRQCRQGPQCRLQPHVLMAADLDPAQTMALQRRAQARVETRPHLRAVALDAIGLPGQIGRAQQGQRAAALEVEGRRHQRRVIEVMLAAQCRDQRRGVAEHERMLSRGGIDACRLLGGDVSLFMPQRRAAVGVAPFAQIFADQPGVAMPGQCRGQRGLAGAFGAEQRDQPGRQAACLQARQPMRLIGMKPA